MKKKTGRPPIFKSPEELEKKIEDYFKNCPDKRLVFIGTKEDRHQIEVITPTISGLVLYCGFVDRMSFYDYEKKPQFSNIIKKARSMIEREYEKDLKAGLGTGAIFALKQFGWIDEQKISGAKAVYINYVGSNKRNNNSAIRLRPVQQTTPS
jgi:hypothetical protein